MLIIAIKCKFQLLTPRLLCLQSFVIYVIGESQQILFEVYVNAETAAQLNSGDDKIEDIVVLHLDGGKDFFVSLNI